MTLFDWIVTGFLGLCAGLTVAGFVVGLVTDAVAAARWRKDRLGLLRSRRAMTWPQLGRGGRYFDAERTPSSWLRRELRMLWEFWSNLRVRWDVQVASRKRFFQPSL